MAGYLIAPTFTLVGGAYAKREYTYIYEDKQARIKCVKSKVDDETIWKLAGTNEEKYKKETMRRRNMKAQPDMTAPTTEDVIVKISTPERRFTDICVVNESFAIATDNNDLVCLIDHGLQVPDRAATSETKFRFNNQDVDMLSEDVEELKLNSHAQEIVDDFVTSYRQIFDNERKRLEREKKKLEKCRKALKRMKKKHPGKRAQRKFGKDILQKFGFTSEKKLKARYKQIKGQLKDLKKGVFYGPPVDAHFVLEIIRPQITNAIHVSVPPYTVFIPCYPGPTLAETRRDILRRKQLDDRKIKELTAMYDWFLSVDNLVGQ